MRISDWSSDVCSSDLLYALVAGPSFRKGLGRPLTRTRRTHAAHLDLRRPALARSGGVWPLLRGGLRLDCRRPARRDVPPHRARGRVSRRSDEHTSELQSLMRLSSAVSCLTKKNKSTL